MTERGRTSTVNRFKDKEMESLFSKIFELGSLTERALSDAIWALSHQDKNLARQVLDGDDAVDELALEINTVSFQLIARYQPVAFDLRALEACIRMALDLERITDLAVNIARVTLDLDVRIKPLKNLEPMGMRVIAMLNTSMSALLRRDVSAAKEVFAMDDAVDDYEDGVFAELMEIVMETPALTNGSNKIITVARVLERAGDHVTNLAEHICYMIAGNRVRAADFRRVRTEDK
ncbi:MAG: phosphate signaling complex protein PhoU [Synergistaceae bacterium]|jgi:phosphate transport system protein|nr:phosphate signaling complex protein PhoU [Synergistaceae bacterium]